MKILNNPKIRWTVVCALLALYGIVNIDNGGGVRVIVAVVGWLYTLHYYSAGSIQKRENKHSELKQKIANIEQAREEAKSATGPVWTSAGLK